MWKNKKSSWLWRHMLFVVYDEDVFPKGKLFSFLYVFFMDVSFLFHGYFVILWELFK